jgi:hypothetical protein
MMEIQIEVGRGIVVMGVLRPRPWPICEQGCDE